MLIDLSWSLVLSAIIGTYLNESTICIFWNDKFEFHLLHKSDYISFVGINIKSFDDNRGHYIVDKRLKEKDIQNKNLFLDDLVIKIIISIEVTHCETFVVFDKDIDRLRVAGVPSPLLRSCSQVPKPPDVTSLVMCKLANFGDAIKLNGNSADKNNIQVASPVGSGSPGAVI
ncbi:uncharacterized protein LOC6620526 isoform X2 [Drosophila sechellia]|uniref:uncharacterized protein LOC6620526 isoform X2 n=1 Tax=Drosophila sechellia TaxID=7238 RepID=UPI0013DE6868|nr:uncharacterized protein LOC6620526 isoform X2 [Drosophila sechellia]